ncbi:MAG: FHA domain-containing protein [Anaerolineales bacterium]|nr:FHA domain-containing protein [Anaerolineales bacterium]
MAEFQLVMRSGPNAGKTYPLDQPEVTIGRDTTNTIPINDAEISRKHARLILKGNEYIIEDFGSTNGTFVSGQRITAPRTLRAGELISFGENIVVAYEATADPNATMISAKAPRNVTAQPAPAPAPAPRPVYSGQVPAGPPPEMADPAKKTSNRTIMIIVAAVVLVCVCLVSAILWFAPESFYCATVPFLFPGACP